MSDEQTVASAAVPLVEDLDVRVAMADLDGTVELGVEQGGEPAQTETIAPEDAAKGFALDLGPLSIDLDLGADNERGEVFAKGKVELGDRTLLDLDEVLVHYAPAHGSVGGRADANPPAFSDERFGKSRMSSKNVTRVFVEDRDRVLADVGRVVKRALWDDYPDWVFNTVACVGEFDAQGRGSYSNPDSIWFNVFLGYYQIDAPKADWGRPFAYESASGADSKVRFDELARLGKTDWNYISNWMYGVPDEAALRHNELELSHLRTQQRNAGAIGTGTWHRVTVGNVNFVSVYESDAEGADRLVYNSLASGLWRKAFGTPCPDPEFGESFIATRMVADMYMAYWEDDEAFHTTIFGGTAPVDAHPDFLAGQMSAAARVIESAYPDLGFDAEG